MDLSKLKEPFPANEIEWRLQSSGTGSRGVWARCLAYVTNRAICNRLDEVCGPENWKNEFIKGPDGGILCGISIKVGEEWVTKYDGAENTNIEAVKGGLSGAMKRAASTGWGIGRYLYNLEEGFATILPEDSKEKAFAGKTKEGTKFKWLPPKLPSWALPGGSGKNVNDNQYADSPEEPVDNSNDEPSEEVVEQTTILEGYINDGILKGKFLEKAKMYIDTRNLEGIKNTNEWCKSQKSA